MKVHFAATENVNQFNVIKALGHKYNLYTAYPFLERQLFNKPISPLIPCQYKGNENEIPKYIIQNSKHAIQDSGLFTLMFGSRSGKHEKAFLDKYYEALVSFTVKYSKGATVVEMDTQKVLGVQSAWMYRKRLKADVPNRIINVFHLEDGRQGLDRLIEYSDYIALSVPELRKTGKKNQLIKLAHYVKNKKPKIDIHLLGFSDTRIMSELRFCTSCDSSSYTSGVRYGAIGHNKVNNVDIVKTKKLISVDDYEQITKFISEKRACGLIINTRVEIDKYWTHAGGQD